MASAIAMTDSNKGFTLGGFSGGKARAGLTAAHVVSRVKSRLSRFFLRDPRMVAAADASYAQLSLAGKFS